jgi:hypothetical protein
MHGSAEPEPSLPFFYSTGPPGKNDAGKILPAPKYKKKNRPVSISTSAFTRILFSIPHAIFSRALPVPQKGDPGGKCRKLFSHGLECHG